MCVSIFKHLLSGSLYMAYLIKRYDLDQKTKEYDEAIVGVVIGDESKAIEWICKHDPENIRLDPESKKMFLYYKASYIGDLI